MSIPSPQLNDWVMLSITNDYVFAWPLFPIKVKTYLKYESINNRFCLGIIEIKNTRWFIQFNLKVIYFRLFNWFFATTDKADDRTKYTIKYTKLFK